MIKKHFFLKISLLFIVAYWMFDSAMHYFVYNEIIFEFIPSDNDELWMRSFIVFLLISFAIFADSHARKIAEKEQEKMEVYISMLNANQHILNNFLQAMMMLRRAADKSKDIDDNAIAFYDKAIKKTMTQINNLHGITEPNKSTIEERFLPKNFNDI